MRVKWCKLIFKKALTSRSTLKSLCQWFCEQFASQNGQNKISKVLYIMKICPLSDGSEAEKQMLLQFWHRGRSMNHHFIPIDVVPLQVDQRKIFLICTVVVIHPKSFLFFYLKSSRNYFKALLACSSAEVHRMSLCYNFWLRILYVRCRIPSFDTQIV